MPKSPPKRCKNPICKNRFEENPTFKGKKGYCEPCTEKRALKEQAKPKPKDRSNDLHDVESQKFYNSRTWRKLSARHRTANPLCKHCLDDDVVTPVAVADHIIELKDDWTLRLDPTNLQPLCHACHNRKTAKEKRKREKAGLF